MKALTMQKSFILSISLWKRYTFECSCIFGMNSSNETVKINMGVGSRANRKCMEFKALHCFCEENLISLSHSDVI